MTVGEIIGAPIVEVNRHSNIFVVQRRKALAILGYAFTNWWLLLAACCYRALQHGAPKKISGALLTKQIGVPIICPMTPDDLYTIWRTQEEMAKALGLAQPTISGWFTDGKIPEPRQYQIQIVTGGRLVADKKVAA